MGNSASYDAEDSGAVDLDGLPTLDALGGYNRPAVSRSAMLATKLNWIGMGVHNAADNLENVLQRDNSKARKAMNDQGGSQSVRSKKYVQVFGRTTVLVNEHQSAYPGKPNEGGAALDPSMRRSLQELAPPSRPPPLRPSTSDVTARLPTGGNRSGMQESENKLQAMGKARRLSLLTPGSYPSIQPPSGTNMPQTSPTSPQGPSIMDNPLLVRTASPLSASLTITRTPPATPLFRRRASVDGAMRNVAPTGHVSLLEAAAADPLLPPTRNVSLQYMYNRMQPPVAFSPRSSSQRSSPSLSFGHQHGVTPPSPPRSMSGSMTFGPPPGSPGRRKTKARALPAPTLPPESEWRQRVRNSKRRLYWYLKAYMAWVSVLRRKRSGYADEMPLDVLPVFLANALGTHMAAYGELLNSSQQSASEGHDKHVRLAALQFSRRYFSNVRAKALRPKTGRRSSNGSSMSAPLENERRSSVTAPDFDALLPHTGSSVPDNSIVFSAMGDATSPTATVPSDPHQNRRMTWGGGSAPEPHHHVTARTQEAEMAGISNRVNAQWVEARGSWHAPQVLDMNSVASHTDLYRQVSSTLLQSGKVAINLVYLGEEQTTGIDKAGKEKLQPLLSLDLWDAVCTLFPHKVPRGQRIVGVSLLSRRILQAIVDLERAVGHAGVESMTLLLSIDSMYVDWVLAELLLFRHYCLRPEQIVIVSIARFPGCTYDSAHHVFMLNYDATTREPAGSGYALLAMAWASSTFWLDAMGERQYLSGSCLGWLMRSGVEWIHSSMVIDFDSLSPTGPSHTDINFLGPAIFACDHRGASMAMEVARAPTDATVRRQCNIVLSPNAMEPFSCAISTKDLHSAATRTLVANSEKDIVPGTYKGGNFVSCNHRYMYNVQHMLKLVQGPVIFRPDVSCTNGHAYLTLEQTDLTSINALGGVLQSKCVAVLGRHKGPDTRHKVHTREWLREFGATLMAQDTQEAFRMLVSRASVRAAIATTSASVNAAHPQDRGIKMVLYVTDSPIAAKCAFRMARSLMRSAADCLHLVYVMATASGAAPALTPDIEKAMGSFHDILLDGQIVRRTLAKGDKVIATILDDVTSLSPELVIMGSEKLSQVSSASAAGGAAMSIALAVCRGLRDVPMLVVKINGAGRLLQATDAPGQLPPLRVLLEASTAGMGAASFIIARLHSGYGRMTPQGEDKLFIGRPFGLDKENKVTHHSSRLISVVARDAANHGITSELRPIAKGAMEGFPQLIAQDQIDMLVINAPSAASTPPAIVDLIKGCRCAILVFRMREVSGLSR